MGPLLFYTALLFADRNIQTIQSALQEDLNAVGEWFSLNCLLATAIKSMLCFLALNSVSQDHKDCPYYYWANFWSSLRTLKYLGLTFDASMCMFLYFRCTASM